MWGISAGERHTLLLADGDCIQPIIYYSGQQVNEEPEAIQDRQEDEEEGVGGYTQQPVLLPFCMNVWLIVLFKILPDGFVYDLLCLLLVF